MVGRLGERRKWRGEEDLIGLLQLPDYPERAIVTRASSLKNDPQQFDQCT